MRPSSVLAWGTLPLAVLGRGLTMNSTYNNPIIPGWNSDPSCTYVADKYDAFFCVTSTFLAFPGLPVYASKNLMNWKLASNAFSRPSQVPWIASSPAQADGIFAATIRYRKGVFYVITVYLGTTTDVLKGLIFTTENPYDDKAWSEPVVFDSKRIDPDIFWDDDGQPYVALSSGDIAKLDIQKGALGPLIRAWPGTGGVWPEGPHIYKKDGYYYMLLAEGGTELGHMVTIARSRNITGPYEGYKNNPILTNRNTTEYFQTIGHADLFQDKLGQWWGVALATRGGKDWVNYPMGRETVLYPVTWEKDQWPVLEPVRGKMSGWPLPPSNGSLPGNHSFINDPDVVDFLPGSSLPGHFVHWRFPKAGSVTVSPPSHPNTLRLTPSKSNLTSSSAINVTDGITLVMRRQTDTLFDFNVDVSFSPTVQDEEAGITIFLTQEQHIDLGIVLLPTNSSSASGGSKLTSHLRLRTTADAKDSSVAPLTRSRPISEEWLGKPIRLNIQAFNETHYSFSAASSADVTTIHSFGIAPATIFSGGAGKFTGRKSFHHALMRRYLIFVAWLLK